MTVGLPDHTWTVVKKTITAMCAFASLAATLPSVGSGALMETYGNAVPSVH
jgi:hypothetical protein